MQIIHRYHCAGWAHNSSPSSDSGVVIQSFDGADSVLPVWVLYETGPRTDCPDAIPVEFRIRFDRQKAPQCVQTTHRELMELNFDQMSPSTFGSAVVSGESGFVSSPGDSQGTEGELWMKPVECALGTGALLRFVNPDSAELGAEALFSSHQLQTLLHLLRTVLPELDAGASRVSYPHNATIPAKKY